MHRPTIQLVASSRHPLVDEPTGLEISGCPPDTEVAVTATVDVGGSRLAAAARYRADAEGRVDTATADQRRGYYRGVDPFGLWWSGTPTGTSPRPADAAVEAELRIEAGPRSVPARTTRHWLAPGTTVAPVDDPGIVGFFARPAGPGPFPAVVAFGGSAGGLFGASVWAPLLASHGVATLAIAYFGMPGLPPELVGIEIERVERAVAWLLDRADVRGPVAVDGRVARQ